MLLQEEVEKEKKLLALENAYLTLKKVLFKYFSLEAKQSEGDNVSTSLRRSFHEALNLQVEKFEKTGYPDKACQFVRFISHTCSILIYHIIRNILPYFFKIY